jgi:hypothetical protein
MMPFILTILTVLIAEDHAGFFRRQYFYLFALGFTAGYLPAIIYNMQYPNATLFRALGRVLKLDRSVLASSSNMKEIIMSRIWWRISTVPAALAKIPALFFAASGIINTALFFISAAWVSMKIFIRPSPGKKTENIGIPVIYILWFSLCYAFLIGINRLRYVIPLYVVFPLIAGSFLSAVRNRSKIVATVLISVIILYNGCDNIYAFVNREYRHYSELSGWLLPRKIFYGYSDYSTAYAVTFYSREKILISPTLYHPTFYDRKPEYTAAVRKAEGAAYIIDERLCASSSGALEEALKRSNVGYKKDRFEEFVIYHGLSRKVYPEDVNMERLDAKQDRKAQR